uniref:glycosyltransferase n=1 Tax=Flavobacterium sp. TaxID=239 RepID=UPI00404B53CA
MPTNTNIRIIQLIDSLEAGGAERMAVNYANTLADVISFSALVTTRKEGALKQQLSSKVSYLFLNKKGKIGLKAVWKLRAFIKQNKVDLIHAHSTSFFTAILVKLICPKVKIVWHDHYGNSEFLDQRSTKVLLLTSVLFEGIISVNEQLKNWAVEHLKFSNVIYLPNFVFFTEENKNLNQTKLFGQEDKRIVCLANLREQKNHFMLLEVAALLKISHSDWSFHLVGKDFEDNYSSELKNEIVNHDLSENVFLYGSRDDIGTVLKQCSIAILTSKSEGLPVALLEYGFYKKPVVSTAVGEVGTVIRNNENGILVTSDASKEFYNALVSLIEDLSIRKCLADKLYQDVTSNYSEKAVIGRYLEWLDEM